MEATKKALRIKAADKKPAVSREQVTERNGTHGLPVNGQGLRMGYTTGSCAAAAAAAAADMLLGGGGVEQMQAGDVSLRLGPGGGACEAAAVLRRQCALLMAPYWEDDGFAFAGVRG